MIMITGMITDAKNNVILIISKNDLQDIDDCDGICAAAVLAKCVCKTNCFSTDS